MHAPPPQAPPGPGGGPAAGPRGDRLWLIAGTGEGPPLARRLLERGWRPRVSVVSAGARRAYPVDPRLEVVVGALEGAAAWRGALEEAERRGDPFQWLIDASHPFATRVTAAALAACEGRPERVLRLHRPPLAAPRAIPLGHLGQLGGHLARGERLLLAIGARQLAEAVGHSATARHHGRVLPHPQAIRQALRAGLAPERLACLRPSADGGVERALCRLWGIETILCRQSGSPTEALWLRISEELGLRLLLLSRPPEPPGVARFPLEELIEHVGWPRGLADG
ncbi:MAG: precorrin-6A/cobalt-precorrin-6A reductase [Cyanobacteriota bacterium]|nr:precorrin-6A/cobalt-precorrin-6A reductase [Cyanobacteriota bacterium]